MEVIPSRPAPSIPTPKSDERNPEPYTPKIVPVAAGPSVVGLLQERIVMYERAEANATISGESSRARR